MSKKKHYLIVQNIGLAGVIGTVAIFSPALWKVNFLFHQISSGLLMAYKVLEGFALKNVAECLICFWNQSDIWMFFYY